jgi:crotonobetainyl-CoA:carnitine CoA-transferase CaiB-like acyl-CoA transferase
MAPVGPLVSLTHYWRRLGAEVIKVEDPREPVTPTAIGAAQSSRFTQFDAVGAPPVLSEI